MQIFVGWKHGQRGQSCLFGQLDHLHSFTVGYTLPCGGPAKGKCAKIQQSNENFTPEFPNNSEDDRIDWPLRFFSYACKCHGHYHGHMCQNCQFGYRGKNCQEKYTIQRRNVLTLHEEEKKNFITILLQARNTISDFVIQNDIIDIDPSRDYKYTEVSVYEYFIWHHAYAARATLPRESGKSCNSTERYDHNHGNPNFPLWHRHFMLKVEQEFRRIAKDENFAIPYWDWLDQGTYCNVCINDLVGNTKSSDAKGHLEKESPFSNWQIKCDKDQSDENYPHCSICDWSQNGGLLRRKVKRNNMLPNRKQYDNAFRYDYWEKLPYTGHGKGFRHGLEGKGDTMHNQVS